MYTVRHAMKPTMLLKISVLVLAASVEAVGATGDGVRRLASKPSPKNCDALNNFKEVCKKSDRKKLTKVCEKSEKKCTKFCNKKKKGTKLSKSCKEACCQSPPPPPPSPSPPSPSPPPPSPPCGDTNPAFCADKLQTSGDKIDKCKA